MTNPTDTPTNPNPGDPMTTAPAPSTPPLNPNPKGDQMPTTPDPSAPHTNPTGDPMPPDDDESMADTERTIPPETLARAALHGLASELGADEVRVLARIAERLRGGQETYGPLQLTTDTRMFRTQEAREEIEDALVSFAYFACAWLKTETNHEVNR